MNKPLSAAELEEVAVALPPTGMTRREKLLRWAVIVRNTKSEFRIFHRLEHMDPQELANIQAPQDSAFAAATADPILRDAGLTGSTIGDNMKFFELNQSDLHAFSCDCGGRIDNGTMADRIAAVAERRSGYRIVNGIRRAINNAGW